MKYAESERKNRNGDNDVKNRLNIQYTFIFIIVGRTEAYLCDDDYETL